MKKTILFIILAVGLVLTGCVKQTGKNASDEINNIQPVDSTSMGGQVENDADNGEVATDNGEITIEKGTSASSVQGNDKIKIFNIEDGQTIFSPVTIQGKGVAFENNLIIELRNKDHVALVKEFTMIKSNEAGEIGDYSITLEFEFSSTKEGFIAVYEQSAKDGSELNLVEIPVKFGNLDISNWQTYRNEKMGFEFKYPEEWNIFIDKDTGFTWDNYERWTEGLISVFEVKNTKKDEVAGGCSTGGPGDLPIEGMSFRIVLSGKGNKTFDTIINDCIEHSENGKCETGVEVLNENNALVIYNPNTKCNYPSAHILKNNVGYSIETVWNGMSDKTEYYEELYYRMLNTFKFIN